MVRAGDGRRIRICLSILALMVIPNGLTMAMADTGPGPSPPPEDPWWVDWSRDLDNNRIDEELEHILSTAGPGDMVRVLVDFDRRPEEAHVKALEQAGSTIDYRCKYLDTVIVEVPTRRVEELLDVPDVVMLEADLEIERQLDSASRSVQLDVVKGNWSYTGDGVVIGIVDSGVDANHTGLNDLDDINDTYDPKVIAFYDAKNHPDQIDGSAEPYDDDGHGSHVTGIASGTGEGSPGYKWQGVAPGSKIVGIKVLGPADNSMSDAMKGLEWARDVKDRYKIRILSLSFGARLSTGVTNDGTSAISRLCDDLVKYGFVVIVAAGNSGPRRRTIAPPGDARQVITVGNVEDSGILNPSSSRGPVGGWTDNYIKPDICAPGTNIYSVQYNTISNYTEMTGTSMSAPFASGVVALMFQVDPSLTPTQVKTMLQQTAGGEESYPMQGTPNNDYGYGGIRPYEIINNMTKGVRPPRVFVDDLDTVVRGVVTISGTAESEFGSIQGVEVQVGDRNWDSATGGDMWSYEWDTTEFLNGQVEVRFRAYDGNLYSVLVRKYHTINNIEIESNMPANAAFSGNSTIKGVTRGLIIKSVEARIDDGMWLPAVQTSANDDWSSWEFGFSTKEYKGKRHTFQARAFDGYAYTESKIYSITFVVKEEDKALIPGFEPVLIILAMVLVALNTRPGPRRGQ